MFDNLPPLLLAHFIAACMALPLGLHQLAAPQGTPKHALAGRVYVPVMLVCNVTALSTLFTGDARGFLFSPFHILAVLSLYSLVGGFRALRRWLRARQAEDLRLHKIHMAYSWLGLLMAGISQLLVNDRFGLAPAFEPVRFWGSMALINGILYGMGSWWIFKRLLTRQLG